MGDAIPIGIWKLASMTRPGPDGSPSVLQVRKHEWAYPGPSLGNMPMSREATYFQPAVWELQRQAMPSTLPTRSHVPLRRGLFLTDLQVRTDVSDAFPRCGSALL